MNWLDWILRLIRGRQRPIVPPPLPEPPQGDKAAQCIDEHNTVRSRLGLSPLTGDDCLAQQAQQHAETMRRTRRLTHDGFSNRLAACARGAGGENVAMGKSTPKSVVDGWMGSSGHRANITKAGYKSIGVGYDGGYWCAIYSY